MLFSFGYIGFKHLSALIHEVKIEAQVAFKQTTGGTSVDLSEIKNDLLDLVHNTISEMQPPSASDHLFGALAQILQMKVMKGMGMDPSSLISQPETED